MKILSAIRNEQHKIQKRIAALQGQLNALQSAAEALNGRPTRSNVRHRKGWSAAARKAQSARLKSLWAKRQRKGLKVAA